MKKHARISIIALICIFSLHCYADSEVSWTAGSSCPGPWEVDASDPANVTFSGPVDTVWNNAACAEEYYGGIPTIDIDHVNKTVTLWFEGPPVDPCLHILDPVCGLEGWFGTLDTGVWLFISPFANIQFPVGNVDIVTILSPNGGEYFLAGSTRKIRWKDSRYSACGGNYLLDYSTDNGANWLDVDPSSVTGCSYDWQVPVANSDQCLVMITDQSDPSLTDQSNTTFYIYQCQGPVTKDSNNDCYVDNHEFIVIYSGWLTTMDITDILDLAANWLNCGNPYDPVCD